MKPVHFVDTTLRDGHLSLWACAMRTDWMLPVVARIDQAGFRAIELMSTSIPKKMVRELKKDPWERVRLFAKLAPRTPLRVIMGRYITSFEITPASITNLWLERLVANGIREVRMSDCSNTVSEWERLIRDSRRAGLKIVLKEVRKHLGDAGVSDDELLLRYLAGTEEVAAMRASPRPQRGIDTRLPLVTLINELAKRTSLSQIKIERERRDRPSRAQQPGCQLARPNGRAAVDPSTNPSNRGPAL